MSIFVFQDAVKVGNVADCQSEYFYLGELLVRWQCGQQSSQGREGRVKGLKETFLCIFWVIFLFCILRGNEELEYRRRKYTKAKVYSKLLLKREGFEAASFII